MDTAAETNGTLRHPAVFDFTCPHCAGRVQVGLTVENASSLTRAMTPEDRAAQWLADAPAAIRTFIAEQEATGVMESFRRAVSGLPKQGMPNNVAKFFFGVLSRMEPMPLSPAKAEALMRAVGAGYIVAWQANGIVAVTMQNRLKGFVAVPVLDNMSESTAEIVSSNFTGEWIRTRFGYVTSPVLFSEFRKKSIGAWDAMRGNK